VLHRLRPHLTYANVVATLCMFLLLGGTAAAVDGSLAGQNTVGSMDIINGEVLTADLGPNSVTSGKIADGEVKNADLGPNAAASNTIADAGVKGIDIANGQVTGADVGNESLTEDEIEDIVSSGGVTRLAVGEEKTLLQDGPFTVTATCNPEPIFERALIVITSSEEHSIASLDADGSGGGGGEIPDSGRGYSAPHESYGWQGSHFFAAAPSGATLEGYIGTGFQVLGYDDCTAVVTAIGASELDGP
jgi:hypothetical protein